MTESSPRPYRTRPLHVFLLGPRGDVPGLWIDIWGPLLVLSREGHGGKMEKQPRPRH